MNENRKRGRKLTLWVKPEIDDLISRLVDRLNADPERGRDATRTEVIERGLRLLARSLEGDRT